MRLKTSYFFLLLLLCAGSLYSKNEKSEYEKGVEALLESDYSKALLAFEKAIENGNIDAYFSLGKMYFNGIGTPIDKQKAYIFAKKGYEEGSIASTYLLALLEGKYFVDHTADKELAQKLYNPLQLEWFKNAFQSDKNPTYAVAIGSIYDHGVCGVEEDLEKAVKWYQTAADTGFSYGQKKLAYMYQYGEGVEKDYQKAFYYNQLAADQDYPGALVNLGYLLNSGKGVKKNMDRALMLYKKAAELNDSWAAKNLAFMYDTGDEIEVDWIKARQYFEQAAADNNKYAQRELGEYYFFGIGGLDRDIPKAKALFGKASKAGDEIAASYLQVLDDIENKKFHRVNTSSMGNSLSIDNEMFAKDEPKFPYITGENLEWYTKIDYSLGQSDYVKIWPTKRIKKVTDKTDYFWFTNYSGCSGLTEKKGTHTAGISILDYERGYRDIAYTYFMGEFAHEEAGMEFVDEVLYIKYPVAMCQLPKNHPPVSGARNILTDAQFTEALIGKWKFTQHYIRCKNNKDNLHLMAEGCYEKNTAIYKADGTGMETTHQGDDCSPSVYRFKWRIEDRTLKLEYDSDPNVELQSTSINLYNGYFTVEFKTDECEDGLYARQFKKTGK